MIPRAPCRTLDGAFAGIALAALSSCVQASHCDPGALRACEGTVDGGFVHRGYQSCEATSTWGDCLPIGPCMSPGGSALPVYARCTTSATCGPSECAVCGSYAGVRNPAAYGICYPFCQVDLDCAPPTASQNVTPRCVLGQCALLCHTTSTCPNDSQCLVWNDATSANRYPGFDGLCE